MAGLAVDEEGDRHAPCALAAQHPVGAVLDHRSDAVAALFGDEARDVDRLHRCCPQRRGVAEAFLGGIDCAALILPALFARGRSEEHTSDIQSLMRTSYVVL